MTEKQIPLALTYYERQLMISAMANCICIHEERNGRTNTHRLSSVVFMCIDPIASFSIIRLKGCQPDNTLSCFHCHTLIINRM